MASSAELLATCQAGGLLSKEAADKVAAVRNELIRNEMRKLAAGFWAERFGRDVEPVAKKALTFVEKLKTGGRSAIESTKEGLTSPAWSDVGLNLGKMLALSGLTAGAAAGVQGIMHHSRDAKLKEKIKQSSRQVFD